VTRRFRARGDCQSIRRARTRPAGWCSFACSRCHAR